MPSPRYTFGGNFRKFGTDSYAISGTFCAFALRIAPCAKAVPDQMSPATTPPAMKTRLMCEASEGVEPAIYTGSGIAAYWSVAQRYRLLTLVFASLACAAPLQVEEAPVGQLYTPRVSTTIDTI